MVSMETLQQQAANWINQRNQAVQARSRLIEEGGPILSLKPQELLTDSLPPPLRLEVERQLEASRSN